MHKNNVNLGITASGLRGEVAGKQTTLATLVPRPLPTATVVARRITKYRNVCINLKISAAQNLAICVFSFLCFFLSMKRVARQWPVEVLESWHRIGDDTWDMIVIRWTWQNPKSVVLWISRYHPLTPVSATTVAPRNCCFHLWSVHWYDGRVCDTIVKAVLGTVVETVCSVPSIVTTLGTTTGQVLLLLLLVLRLQVGCYPSRYSQDNDFSSAWVSYLNSQLLAYIHIGDWNPWIFVVIITIHI